MIRPWSLIWTLMYPEIYRWVDVILIKETSKAVLIQFNNRQAWLPKVWIRGIRHDSHCEGCRRQPETLAIKISEYHWAKKFA